MGGAGRAGWGVGGARWRSCSVASRRLGRRQLRTSSGRDAGAGPAGDRHRGDGARRRRRRARSRGDDAPGHRRAGPTRPVAARKRGAGHAPGVERSRRAATQPTTVRASSDVDARAASRPRRRRRDSAHRRPRARRIPARAAEALLVLGVALLASGLAILRGKSAGQTHARVVASAVCRSLPTTRTGRGSSSSRAPSAGSWPPTCGASTSPVSSAPTRRCGPTCSRVPMLRSGPTTSTWSPLEYACHVRDVFRIFDARLGLMLTEDDPTFANWDQDVTAVDDAYGEQDPATVAAELVDAGVAARGSLRHGHRRRSGSGPGIGATAHGSPWSRSPAT